ncbi:hypothetical protein ILUMI_20251 [Ignelater luminosus]|uniref:Uncharacterized protein n=1 Tax=Ignelater luminosus TaxID=2038154 RepID=A0A8K0CKZ5_IGNLU|nr:hypothetical protein ILUMI_20251 [Ignelater luminosus]
MRGTGVYRGPEIESDHYTVIANLVERQLERKIKKKTKMKQINEKINVYQVKKENVKKRYNLVEQKIGNSAARREEGDLEDLWITFKETLLEAAEEVCVKQKCGQPKKKTRWWSTKVQEAVR